MSKPPDDIPTHHENFLYLLSELERVVERDLIQWNEGLCRCRAAPPGQARGHCTAHRRWDQETLMATK
jgi:hypothetical protein